MDGTILGREIFGFGRSVFVVRHSSRETRPAQTHAQTLFTDPQPLPTGWQGVISGLLLSTTSARSVWRQSAALLYARYKWACCACFARTRKTNRDSNVNYVAFGPDEFEPSRSLPRANEAGERANGPVNDALLAAAEHLPGRGGGEDGEVVWEVRYESRGAVLS